MRESSERLLTLLRGGRVARPPFWEPWFAMGEMLRTGAAKQRFIAGGNTSPQDYIPVENYRAFLHAVRDWQP